MLWVTMHFLLRAMFVQVWKALVSFSDFQILFHGIQRGLRYRREDWDGRSWVERAPGTSLLLARVVPCSSRSHVRVLYDISTFFLKKRLYWKKELKSQWFTSLGLCCMEYRFTLVWLCMWSREQLCAQYSGAAIEYPAVLANVIIAVLKRLLQPTW